MSEAEIALFYHMMNVKQCGPWFMEYIGWKGTEDK